jgi:hypothetical protein
LGHDIFVISGKPADHNGAADKEGAAELFEVTPLTRGCSECEPVTNNIYYLLRYEYHHKGILQAGIASTAARML